jgi:hypothetical protein
MKYKIEDFLEQWGFVILGFSIVIIAFILIAVLGHKSCSVRADLLGLPFDYDFFSLVDCRVLVNDAWIAIENYCIR